MKSVRAYTLPLLLALAPFAQASPSTAPVAIGAVQGSGAQSPMLGQPVTVEGVVVGGFAQGLGGIFVQDMKGDGDERTSDGLFVALPADSAAPRTGSLVRIRGTVTELGQGKQTLTALTDARIQIRAASVRWQAQALAAPPAHRDDWERFEGMAVVIAAPLTVTGNERLLRFGEIDASFGGRLYQSTEVAAPGPLAKTLRDDNARRLLIIDDGRTSENPRDLWFLPSGLDDAHALRAGSILRGATGVIDQRRGDYRLQLSAPLDAIEYSARPAAPEVAGNLRIASLNVLNLFNGDGKGGGFPTARGAETFAQYQMQQRKLVASVQALKPDVAALMEIENDGTGPESALAQFVAALNAAGPSTDYRFVDSGKGPGTNPIRVALIYRSSRVTPVGKPAVLEGGPFAERSRVPLAQAFRAGRGKPFVIVANHLKSKGCGRDADAATGADADLHDGQSCWNALRVESARRVDAWLQTHPTGVRTDLQLLVGDFNAYAQEDPIRTLERAGWQDAFVLAKTVRPYSFVFDGNSGRLDHALVSPGLATLLRGAAEWHNNADESDRFDYHDDVDGDPYRASDHDPFVLGFDLSR